MFYDFGMSHEVPEPCLSGTLHDIFVPQLPLSKNGLEMGFDLIVADQYSDPQLILTVYVSERDFLANARCLEFSWVAWE